MDTFRPAAVKEPRSQPATDASASIQVWYAPTRVQQFLRRRTCMMVFQKRTFLVAIGLVLVMFVSACGSTTSTGSTASTPTAAATPTTTASTSAIQTAQATVK